MMNISEIFEMDEISCLISEIEKKFEGESVPNIRKNIKNLFSQNISYEKCYQISKALSNNNIYEVRFFGALLLGPIAAKNLHYLDYLKNVYCCDENWRVQEANAKAFDLFCENYGYEKAIPIIKEWMNDDNENVRRAVSEGLRVWTSRPYFCDHPEVAIELLSLLRNDSSLYVRKSVANCFSDISKKHTEMVFKCFLQWDFSNTFQWYIINNGCRYIKKEFPELFKKIEKQKSRNSR